MYVHVRATPIQVYCFWDAEIRDGRWRIDGESVFPTLWWRWLEPHAVERRLQFHEPFIHGLQLILLIIYLVCKCKAITLMRKATRPRCRGDVLVRRSRQPSKTVPQSASRGVDASVFELRILRFCKGTQWRPFHLPKSVATPWPPLPRAPPSWWTPIHDPTTPQPCQARSPAF